MSIAELLLQEFDQEAKKTRKALSRVPVDKKTFKPHVKSTSLDRLAPHIAQLPDFGETVLSRPGLDFSTGTWSPLQFDSADQLVKAFDEGAEKVRAALKNIQDNAWSEPWKLSFNDTPVFQGSRFEAYRTMFMNHLVHHRAQLGIYLRLTDTPVPATYGPSADETLGF